MSFLNDQAIDRLLSKGFNRWQKYGRDRVYVNATALGLRYTEDPSGAILNATFCGNPISGADAEHLLGCKTYVDVMTGEIISKDDRLAQRVAEVLQSVLGPMPTPGWQGSKGQGKWGYGYGSGCT